jgi:hypothetical protein
MAILSLCSIPHTSISSSQDKFWVKYLWVCWCPCLLQTLWVPLSAWNESLGQVDKKLVGDRQTNMRDCENTLRFCCEFHLRYQRLIFGNLPISRSLVQFLNSSHPPYSSQLQFSTYSYASGYIPCLYPHLMLKGASFLPHHYNCPNASHHLHPIIFYSPF